jgi:hypothetical protein
MMNRRGQEFVPQLILPGGDCFHPFQPRVRSAKKQQPQVVAQFWSE